MPVAREDLGDGPPVVLVHGSLTTSAAAWERQRSLAEHWRLTLVARRGYPPNPAMDWSDFEVDADDLAGVLGSIDAPAHLVGHSYGGLGALFAAVRAPSRVRSLTVAEAPLMALVRGDADVEEQIAAHGERRALAGDARAFYVSFLEALGAPTDTLPAVLPPETEVLARLMMGERPPWDTEIPIDELRRSGLPVLVVTGGWNAALERSADRLVSTLGSAARREVLTGRGHVVQRLGEPFNELLEQFWRDAEESATSRPV